MNHTEAHRTRTVRGQSARLASSVNTKNSGSVTDSAPVAKKPHLARTSRCLSARVQDSAPLVDNDDDDDVGVYSNRVSLMWNMALPILSREISESDAGDVVLTRKDDPVGSSNVTTSSQSKDESVLPEKIAAVAVAPKEPTPPPSPTHRRTRRNGRRVTKAVKVAMEKLQYAQQFLNEYDEDDKDDVIVVDDTSRVESHMSAITIKVRSRSGIHRHQMKLHDSFAEVISKMATVENVSDEDIIMFFNDRTIHAYDSPKSLQLSVADIIDCHIRGTETSVSALPEELDSHFTVDLFFQTTDSKTGKLKLRIRKDEPMEKVMREYCQQLNVRYGSVLFQFDGEQIDSSSTPESLDLESDYCIDVIPK